MIKKIFNILLVAVIAVCGAINYAVQGEYLQDEFISVAYLSRAENTNSIKNCVLDSVAYHKLTSISSYNDALKNKSNINNELNGQDVATCIGQNSGILYNINNRLSKTDILNKTVYDSFGTDSKALQQVRNFSTLNNVDMCKSILQTEFNKKYSKPSAENANTDKVPYYKFDLMFNNKTYNLKFDTQTQKTENFLIAQQSQRWGRDGNHKEAVFALSTLIKMGVAPSVAFEFLFPNINKKIDTILNKVNIYPKDSKVIFTPNFMQKFIITQEKVGYVVDKEKLFVNILHEFESSPQVKVSLHPEETAPQTTRNDNLQRTQLLSSFSTSIASSTPARQNNVKLALKQFNGMQVMPNSEVSFNATTGRRTEDKGYKTANIILDGLFVDGTGGGVCQSSTTLYNALLLADNVEILEANRHSMPVSYVKLGFDAMVAFGSSDLRFKNVGEYPIYIRTYSKNGSVFVEVYGKPIRDGVEKKRRSEVIKYIKPKADIVKKDTNCEFSELMDENGYYRQKRSADGVEVQTYLDYYVNGTLIETKKVRHTTYPAQRGIVYKGSPKKQELPVQSVSE